MSKLEKKPQSLEEKKGNNLIGKFIGNVREGRRKRLIKTTESPSDEEAWNSFSPEQQQEMLQSLESQHDLDLDSLDLSEKIEFEPSKKGGEELKIKSELEFKDSIGKYIMIKGHKCRKYQPGITGFAYAIMQKDRYDRQKNYIKIGFFDKGVAQKYVKIGESGKPNNQETLDNFPENANQEVVEPLESENDIVLDASKLGKIIAEMMHKVPHKGGEQREFKEGIEEEDSIGKYITIDGHKCREYQPGITGFAYRIINDRYNVYDKLELGFYENGKLIKGKDGKERYIRV